MRYTYRGQANQRRRARRLHRKQRRPRLKPVAAYTPRRATSQRSKWGHVAEWKRRHHTEYTYRVGLALKLPAKRERWDRSDDEQEGEL